MVFVVVVVCLFFNAKRVKRFSDIMSVEEGRTYLFNDALNTFYNSITVFVYFAGVCPYNWVEFSDMCYRLGKTPDNYEAAKRACALDSQGRLASIKTNQTAYDITNAISYQGSVSEVWSRYALEKEGNDVVVVDDGVKVDDCVGCMDLINEFTAERSCIAIGQISAVSANWTLVNCNSTYGYICETFTGWFPIFVKISHFNNIIISLD